jgi:predicted CXXCH cytochrome family protein
MRRFAKNKTVRLKLTITLGLIAAAIAAVVISGCGSSGYSTVIPSGHYENGSAKGGIEFNHSRCGACHEGLSGNFSMGSSDLLSAHETAWSLYLSGGELDEQVKQQLTSKEAEMSKYFTTADNSSGCAQCHETAAERDGFKIKEVNSTEFCLECHDSADVEASTAGWDAEYDANPHQSHVDESEELACNSCHQFHGATNTLYCNQCHDFQLPEGWISPMPAE